MAKRVEHWQTKDGAMFDTEDAAVEYEKRLRVMLLCIRFVSTGRPNRDANVHEIAEEVIGHAGEFMEALSQFCPGWIWCGPRVDDNKDDDHARVLEFVAKHFGGGDDAEDQIADVIEEHAAELIAVLRPWNKAQE